MYSQVGKKIMTLAKVCGWISLICGIIAMVINFTDYNYYNNAIGWISLAVGVVGLVLSWPMYGFGQLVDDVHAMRNHSSESAVNNDDLPEL